MLFCQLTIADHCVQSTVELRQNVSAWWTHYARVSLI